MDSSNDYLDFSGLRISLASPENMLEWSHGEVTKPETINYRTFRTEKDGLFDERIFGPTKDYECYCGKYKRMRYKGIVCDRCGVEITTSAVRRERMGHIKLASPIAHIWYFKGPSSVLSIVLEIPPQALERIIYYALYLVKEVNKDKQKDTISVIEDSKKQELKTLEDDFIKQKKLIEEDYKKQKKQLAKKIAGREQREITKQEIDFKEREQLKKITDKHLEQKNNFDFETLIWLGVLYSSLLHIKQLTKTPFFLKIPEHLFEQKWCLYVLIAEGEKYLFLPQTSQERSFPPLKFGFLFPN